MLNRKILAVVLSVSLSLTAAWSQENEETKISSKPIEIELADEAAIVIGGFRITISDAIIKAIENNQNILSGKYDVAMSDTQYEQFQAKYSTYFNAGAGIKTTEYPEMMQRQYGKSNKTVELSSSISKSFSSGTTIAGGLTNSYSDTKWQYTLPDPLYPEKTNTPVLFVSIEQELLKNAFGYNDRKQEKILKNSTLMQKDQIIYGLSLVVVGVIVDYWTVIVNKTQLDNAGLMLQETRKVRRIVSDNVKLGLAEQFELNYWNSLIASSEALVSRAEQNYRDALRKFLQVINMSDEITMQERAILQNKLPELNSEEAIKKAYAKRADYLNAVRSLENAKLQLDIDGNGALPSLTGSITVSSMDVNKNTGESYTNTTSMKYPSYEAQVKLTYPLSDSNQKVNERNSRWKVEQAKFEVDKYSRIVKDDVTSKVEKVNTNYKLYQKAREARIQAEIYYSKMLINLRRGRFTAAVVRNSLDALIGSREAELQMLVMFNASLLEFEVAKNDLFETYKIDVEKYIPKD
jgi:tetratricopeptide (TPR) repeat protein